MQDLTIVLGSNEYTITPEGYSLPPETDTGGVPCIFGISALPDSYGMYILGDVWLRNFIMTLDYVQNTMQFAVNGYAPVGTSITPISSNTPSTGLSTAAVVGGISALVIVVGVVVGILMYRRNKKNELERRVWQETGKQPLRN